MKIAVNTRFLLSDQLEGIGRFTHEVLRRLVARHPEHQFYFFFDRPYDPSFIYGPNVTPMVLYPPARHPFLFYFWFQHRVARALRRLRPDVFLSTDGMTVLETDVPRVTVIHDLAYEYFPLDVSYWQRKYYQRFGPQFARVSEKLVAVSEFTKKDLVRHYDLPDQQVTVISNAVDGRFRPASFEQQVKTRQQYAGGEAYFLFVGALQPRKNLGNLFRAFDLFRQMTGSEVKLLVVGRKAWKCRALLKVHQRMQYRDEVVFTGRVAEGELVRLYGGAVATVYVPALEGFGLPVVEAQACGCPVITSRTSALPEVAGEGALLVDPFAPEEIADALVRVYLDMETRSRLVRAGKENIRRFSWDTGADRMMEVLVAAAGLKRE